MRNMLLILLIFLSNGKMGFSQTNTNVESFKEVKFNNRVYRISKPENYDYFGNSIFKEMSISEFTKTNLLSIEVIDFELLVPKVLDANPLVHFFSYKALENQKVTSEQFKEYKTFWKSGHNNGTYDSIAKSILSDSVIFNQFGIMKSKSNGYTHLDETKYLLSTLVFITGGTNGKIEKFIVISNYLNINETVIYIKLTKSYKNFKDISEIQKDSKYFVSAFLKNNLK